MNAGALATMTERPQQTAVPRTTARVSIHVEADVGVDARLELPSRLREQGFTRPSLILDAALARLPLIASTLAEWEARGLRLVARVEARSGQEPDYAYLDDVTGAFRTMDTDVIIGLGGGSTMDVAKGVGVLLRNPGPGITYRGMDLVCQPGIPVVLLPTTAGSGSEVTATASFIDQTSRTKFGINGRYVGCRFTILDPVLLTTCPASVTIGSGLDALVHAVEAVTTAGAHMVSVVFGAEAVRLMFAGLPQAVTEPSHVEARRQTMVGSHYAGIAMRNAGGGPASGVSYPLGVHHAVPHGFAGGLLLPHVVAFNVAHGYTWGYARLYERLEGAPPLGDDAAKAAAFRDALWDLYQRIKAPTTLSRWGVTRDAVPRLTELTLAQRQANLDANPVPFGRDDVVALLEAVTTD